MLPVMEFIPCYSWYQEKHKSVKVFGESWSVCKTGVRESTSAKSLSEEVTCYQIKLSTDREEHLQIQLIQS